GVTQILEPTVAEEERAVDDVDERLGVERQREEVAALARVGPRLLEVVLKLRVEDVAVGAARDAGGGEPRVEEELHPEHALGTRRRVGRVDRRRRQRRELR